MELLTIEMPVYSFSINNLDYTNIPFSEIVYSLSEVEAVNIVRSSLNLKLKNLSRSELGQYDWMYVREYRMANTATPMPVPENIATHYEAVRQWVDQQELLLASMTIEQLEAHEFIVPSL
jgi:hypothetical protein